MPHRFALLALVASLLVCAPPAAAAPFAPSSVWNAPLSPTAPVSADSSGLVAELGRQVAGYGPWINTTQYSVPVYTVPSTQPTVNVKLDVTNPTLEQAFSAVPLPADARPAKGSDAHLTVYQPSTDRLWEFWRLAKYADGSWHARWGGAMSSVATNPGYFPNPYGATATSLPLLGGLIRIDELRAGVIPHALALAIPEPKASVFTWPAQRTDGTSTNAAAIPEGTHFRLDPNVNVDALPLLPAGKAIARAAQRYGMIVRDRAGAVTLYAEDPTPTGSNPYPTLFGVRYADQLLKNFPWSRLQVVSSSYAARGCRGRGPVSGRRGRRGTRQRPCGSPRNRGSRRAPRTRR
jgi:hypothetical protein